MSTYSDAKAAKLDPYTTKAENNNLTPQEKIDGLKPIIKASRTGMLTSRSREGFLHSRAMTPSAAKSDNNLTLIFIANNASHKFDELDYDDHVNVSFYDPSTTNWASFSGTAKISRNQALIKEHWSHTIASYFGDLHDGIHKGDASDPRVSLIEIIPSEIHYWLATEGYIARTVETAVHSITGKGFAPGELRTITNDEIQLTQGLHIK